MSIPATVDWTPTYLSRLQPRWWGDPVGTCVAAASCYAMEMYGILNVPSWTPAWLSEFDLMYQCRVADGTIGMGVVGTNSYTAAAQLVANGVCANVLWGNGLLVGGVAGTYDSYQSGLSLCGQVPNAAAVANRASHKLLTYTFLTDVNAIKTAISSGFPCVVYWPPNHAVVAWGYTATQFLGLDNRSGSPTPNGPDIASSLSYGAALCIQSAALSGDPVTVAEYPMTDYQAGAVQTAFNAVQQPNVPQSSLDNTSAILQAVTGP